jgi:hypothetical protein
MSFGRKVPAFRGNCASLFMVDPSGRTKHVTPKRRTYLPNTRRHIADNCGLKIYCQKNLDLTNMERITTLLFLLLQEDIQVPSLSPVVLVKIRTAYCKIGKSPFVTLYIYISTPVTFLHCTNWLFSISETDGVLCQVRTEFLYKFHIDQYSSPWFEDQR